MTYDGALPMRSLGGSRESGMNVRRGGMRHTLGDEWSMQVSKLARDRVADSFKRKPHT